MKKFLILIAAMFVWTTLSAAPNVSIDVNYYGIDFSKTKVFGAPETGYQFKNAFSQINSLVIAEWSKYDLGKYLDKNIVLKNISATTSVNNDIDASEIVDPSSEYYISQEEVAEMVRRYELQEEEGTGLVVIGEQLDKSTYMGTFIVVYFDIASREVLHQQKIAGKARGFGLRNYWAGALYRALRGY
jgi:hypothetical protein